MEEQKFKVIIVEDVKLELKGTEEIFRHEIPNAEVIGTAMTESEFWPLMEAQLPDLVLLDLGLGGLSPFQNVLDAQRSLLSYENQLVQAQGSSLLQLIALYKALGGGWRE